MRVLFIACAFALIAGCGEKVPQSETAKKIGDRPKQVLDKAAADTAKALQQGADRSRDDEKKQ